MTLIPWDDVPQDVKEDLRLRDEEGVKEGTAVPPRPGPRLIDG